MVLFFEKGAPTRKTWHYQLDPVRNLGKTNPLKVSMDSQCNDKQQAFLHFMPAHYVSEGVEELDQEKLTPLLRLKYHDSISHAASDLGGPEEIGMDSAGPRST